MVAQLARASDGIGLRVVGVDAEHTEASVKAMMLPRDRNKKNRVAAAMQVALQDDLDHREALADLPSDEPTKTTDSARPNEFWDDSDVVSRSTVALVWWDGAQYAVWAQSV